MPGILNISEAASVAIHSMAYLAVFGDAGPITVREMAVTLSVSENHLSKVMRRLVKAGLADARRGPSGGVSIARKPEEITLLEIYEAIEGKLNTLTCFMKKSLCRPRDCIFGDLLRKINTQVKDRFVNTKLSDLYNSFSAYRNKTAVRTARTAKPRKNISGGGPAWQRER